jgi:hypothetical protein
LSSSFLTGLEVDSVFVPKEEKQIGRRNIGCFSSSIRGNCCALIFPMQ